MPNDHLRTASRRRGIRPGVVAACAAAVLTGGCHTSGDEVRSRPDAVSSPTVLADAPAPPLVVAPDLTGADLARAAVDLVCRPSALRFTYVSKVGGSTASGEGWVVPTGSGITTELSSVGMDTLSTTALVIDGTAYYTATSPPLGGSWVATDAAGLGVDPNACGPLGIDQLRTAIERGGTVTEGGPASGSSRTVAFEGDGIRAAITIGASGALERYEYSEPGPFGVESTTSVELFGDVHPPPAPADARRVRPAEFRELSEP